MEDDAFPIGKGRRCPFNSAEGTYLFCTKSPTSPLTLRTIVGDWLPDEDAFEFPTWRTGAARNLKQTEGRFFPKTLNRSLIEVLVDNRAGSTLSFCGLKAFDIGISLQRGTTDRFGNRTNSEQTVFWVDGCESKWFSNAWIWHIKMTYVVWSQSQSFTLQSAPDLRAFYHGGEISCSLQSAFWHDWDL